MTSARCAACPHRSAKVVPPETSAAPRLVVIGEAPGRNEVEQGRPFVGASGRMLMRGLRTIGLRREDVHWTNAVLCDAGHDPADLAAAAKACRARLRAELAEVAAPVVMPVGAYALQGALQLTKKPQILKWRGSVSTINFGSGKTGTGAASLPRSIGPAGETVDAPAEPVTPPAGPCAGGSRSSGSSPLQAAGGGVTLVAPTIHPAFVMRSPAWGPVLEIDVARVGRLLARGSWSPPEYEPGRRLVIARDLDTLEAQLELLGPAVSFDVETVGLGPTSTSLVCFGLSDGRLTIVVPWSRGRDGRDPWWDDAGRAAAQLTSDALASRVAVMHNGPAFDAIVAARYGLRISAWDDTLLMSHALRGHMPKNLAHTVTRYLDVPPWKELEDRTANLDRLWTYNGRDCLYTILAYQAMRPEIVQ